MVIATTSDGSGSALIRMSPNRASPWAGPVTPSDSPPSATRPTLMLDLTAQVCSALRIVVSQVAEEPSWELSVWKSWLGWPLGRGPIRREAGGQVLGVGPGDIPQVAIN